MGLSTYFLIIKHEACISPEEVAKYQSFCKNSAETTAILDNAHTDRKVKFMHFYTFKYTYKVGDANHIGSLTLTDLPDSLIIPIWYDTTKPELSEENNPCKKYEEIKNKPQDANSQYYLLYGFGCAFLALILFLGAIKRLGRIVFKVDE